MDYREIKSRVEALAKELMDLHSKIGPEGKPLDKHQQELVHTVLMRDVFSRLDELKFFAFRGHKTDFTNSAEALISLVNSLPS